MLKMDTATFQWSPMPWGRDPKKMEKTRLLLLREGLVSSAIRILSIYCLKTIQNQPRLIYAQKIQFNWKRKSRIISVWKKSHQRGGGSDASLQKSCLFSILILTPSPHQSTNNLFRNFDWSPVLAVTQKQPSTFFTAVLMGVC